MFRRIFGGTGIPKPSQLVNNCKKGLSILAEDTSGLDESKRDKVAAKKAKAREEMTETLAAMKFTLYGDTENQADKEKINKLVPKMLRPSEDGDVRGLLSHLVYNIRSLDFESKKDVAAIFNYIIRREPTFYDMVHPDEKIPEVKKAGWYMLKEGNRELIEFLVGGYRQNDIAVNCGTMLREVLRHSYGCSVILERPDLFNQFFEFVQLPNFDVASDAFHTFKMILTKHKKLTARFLDEKYDEFFGKYKELINSHNYVTRRQSLKLLGEILLDRSNFKIMMKYINDRKNLMLMMTLLKAKSKAIQFEAFHVFKVFVANPKKEEGVAKVLLNNKEKLIEFLISFLEEKQESDEQFHTEKQILIEHLNKLSLDDVQPKAAPPQGDDCDEKTGDKKGPPPAT